MTQPIATAKGPWAYEEHEPAATDAAPLHLTNEEQVAEMVTKIAAEVVRQQSVLMKQHEAPLFNGQERRKLREVADWFDAEMTLRAQKIEIQKIKIARLKRMLDWTIKGGLAYLGTWLVVHFFELFGKLPKL